VSRAAAALLLCTLLTAAPAGCTPQPPSRAQPGAAFVDIAAPSGSASAPRRSTDGPGAEGRQRRPARPPRHRFTPPQSEPSTSDLQGAEEQFRKGRQLITTGNYRLACPRFEESMRLAPALGTLLNLAICEEQAGERDRACQLFHDAADWAEQLGQADRGQIARARAIALGCPP
jgi:tetratricopeptide (TPR) repeat protein